jgi:vancomycin resistance protein YoaR
LQQLLISLLLGVVFFIGLFSALLIGYQLLHSGAIFPGVRVAGIDLGGVTRGTASARLTSQFSFPLTGRILLRDGNRTWVVTPAELGLFLDPETSVERAYQTGRSGSIIQRTREQMETWYYGVDLSPAFLFDQRLAYQYLAKIAQEVDTPTIEANLSVEGTEVMVRSGETGRTVDLEATLAALSTQLLSLQDGVINLVVKETPPAVLDASQQAEVARAMLSQPLTLRLPAGQPDQKEWVIERQTLAGMLTIERGPQGYQVGLNASLLRSYLGSLAPNVDVYPQNARFIFNDDTGKLDVLEKSILGRSLDVEATIKVVQEQMAAGYHAVPLVFQEVKPAVEDTASGESLGITELVHAESSYFYGSSAARVQNIEAAASQFHGVLVPPGAVFSMASALGDISLDNGYAEAMIILGGKTIKGVGGGVCQVSTTLFRAAFFAGFPIVERTPHAYRVSYYERVAGGAVNPDFAGLDATVFVPLVDFKFRNDSDHWLLMETYVNPSASSITWKFYGTKDGRSVDWQTTGPINVVPAREPEYNENPELPEGEIKQVDWAVEGADVSVNRTVLRNGAVYFQDTFNTHYEPWADVYEYGPGTELPDPEQGEGN